MSNSVQMSMIIMTEEHVFLQSLCALVKYFSSMAKDICAIIKIYDLI